MSHHAKTGGILTIISGVFCVFYIMIGIFYALMPQWLFKSIINGQPSVQEQDYLRNFLLIFTIIGVLIGLFFALVGALAITGGIFALKKKHWAVAIAGAIAGTILLFPCGIAATILISLGRSEFSADTGVSSSEELQQQAESQVIRNKATTAGILSIISGIFGVFLLGYAFFLNNMFKSFSNLTGTINPFYFVNNMYQTMGIIYIVLGTVTAILGVFAITAGIMTLKRSNWKLGLAGTIAGTITFFPCGIPAILFIYDAYNEFPTNSKPTISGSI